MIGNWRFVRVRDPAPVEIDRSGEAAHVVVTQRMVAASMAKNVAGRPAEAETHLSEAAMMLPQMLTRDDGCARTALLTPPPTSNSEVAWCLWALACVIWREQQELADLRHRYQPGRTSPRNELVDAFIEYLRWVECDPWRLQHPRQPRDESVLGAQRGAVCRRASNLRKFAVPRAGDIDPTVWTRAGRDAGVRALALRRLAAGPLTPWAAKGSLAADVEVRRGRKRASDSARRWLADLEW
jgi:hypothetical protein